MRKREMITTLVGEPARVAHNRQPMGFVQPNIQSMRSDEGIGLRMLMG
jgi:hypothetical protein